MRNIYRRYPATSQTPPDQAREDSDSAWMASLRERVQRFETGRNDEDDTYYRAATDRSALLGRLDFLEVVLRGPALRSLTENDDD